MRKAYKSDEPCKSTQLRNPEPNKKTGRHHCKECMGFTVKDLETYARKIGGVEIERGDTKQDLCNKIFARVGLRGQNQFDKIVSGILGIPAAEEEFLTPPAAVVRSKVVYVPRLTVTNRKINYPEKITQFFLEQAAPVDTLDAAAGMIYRNLEQLLNVWYDEYKLTLSFEDADGKKYDVPKRAVLLSVLPKAKQGKRSTLLINTPKKDAIIGRLEFQVEPRDVVLEEEGPQGPQPVAELADEVALRLLLGEQIETATKKRGVGE